MSRTDTIFAERVYFPGYGGDIVEAYLARPLTEVNVGSVVVIHHMPGFDRSTKEIVRRFAEMGFNAVMVNLNYREAPGASSEDASAATRAAGGVPDARLIGDVSAAREFVLMLSNSNGKCGVIGYCSGGRQSLLSACNIPFNAAVDCYGAFVVEQPPAQYQMNVTPISDQLPNLSCSLLGLFGVEDKFPSPDSVALLAKQLEANGKDFDFHSFDDAGHAFFDPARPSYRVEAATSAWILIENFFNSKLGSGF